MVERIRLNPLNTRKCAEANDRKRTGEVKSRADTEFVVLPGEEPLDFELLCAKVAEEWLPDGPVAEDLVLTVAKCIWRKQRNQSFTAAKTTAAMYDRKSKAYEEDFVLNQFRVMLECGPEEHEIIEFHGALGGYFEHHLKTRCPREKFNSVAEWVAALSTEIDTVLKPADARFGGSRVVLIDRSAAVPDDELFAREIEFDERNDAVMHRALDQLEKLRAAKRRITFLEARRFYKTHPRQLASFKKVAKVASTQDQKGRKNEAG